MSFTEVGTFNCEIDDVALADAQFSESPSAFDICIHGKRIDDPEQSDWWRGEVSNDYGMGSFSAMTRKEITFKTLRKLGFEGDDISKLKEQLMGKQTPFTTKRSKKDDKYINVSYIGSSGNVEPIADDIAKARLKALMSEKVEAPVPTPDPDDENLPF